MPRIFICHPFSADVEGNQPAVNRIARTLALEGHFPRAPQIYLLAFVDEMRERDLALRLCLQLVALADAVRVYGEPTEGMRLESAEASRLGIPVVTGDRAAKKALTGEPPR